MSFLPKSTVIFEHLQESINPVVHYQSHEVNLSDLNQIRKLVLNVQIYATRKLSLRVKSKPTTTALFCHLTIPSEILHFEIEWAPVKSTFLVTCEYCFF